MIPEQTSPIIETISKLPFYINKIKDIQNLMGQIDSRMLKMKTKTQNIVAKKKKEEMAILRKMEKEKEHERMITAQPSKDLLDDKKN